jgi:prepilin-type N-terminal cleavage/methylation domain-containing protein/prepilin-type processing-associated H-X9-DG protein
MKCPISAALVCMANRAAKRPVVGIRRGMSLVELLVAVAILGILAALLLPAIQSARESSRSNTCRNNLKQIGVAILHYESTYKHFPKGAEGRYDQNLAFNNMYGLSWWADTMGFLDETAVANQLDRQGANTGWAALNARNGRLADGFEPPFFFCPSSSVERFVLVGKFQIAAPSYSGISGASSFDGFREARVNASRIDGQISGGGVLVPNAVIQSSQIEDGLSHTLLVGEQSDFAFSQKKGVPLRVGSSWALGWLGGTADLGTPPHYSDPLAISYNLTTIRYPLNEHRYDLPGIYFEAGANNPLLSTHPGTVNVLRCDGSVHAADDSIALDVLKSLSTRDDGDGF